MNQKLTEVLREDELKEKIAINLVVDCEAYCCAKGPEGCFLPCPFQLAQAQQILNILADAGYGKMVMPDCKYVAGYRVHPEPVFQPIQKESK